MDKNITFLNQIAIDSGAYFKAQGIDFTKSPHCLITGTTGSGKSVATRLLMGHLALHDYYHQSKLFICDYKMGDDFQAFREHPYCFRYDYVAEGFNQFYSLFEQRQQGLIDIQPHLFLLFDEYTSWLATLDKKMEADVNAKMLRLLQLGRAFNVHIIIVCQRPDSAWFKAGMRDQFSIRIALGNLSAEARKMMFPDNDALPKVKKRQGYLSIDGKDTVMIEVPTVRQFKKLDRAILRLLNN